MNEPTVAGATQSSLLQFSRDGRWIVVADPDSLSIVCSAGGTPPCQVALPGVTAVAGFADQIWAVAGAPAVLRRFTTGGASLGEPIAVPEAVPGASLIPAPMGAAGALWSGATTVSVIDDLGTIVTQSVAGDHDAVIPMTGRRWITAHDGVVSFNNRLRCLIAKGCRPLGGCVLFDGASLMLLLERADGAREALLLSTANGRVQQRVDLPDGPIRVAHRRGLAAVARPDRTVAMIDLRFGTALGAFRTERDIVDLAIDPDGVQLAVRHDAIDVRLVAIRDALARGDAAAHVAIAATAPEPTTVELGTATPEPDPVAPAAVEAPIPEPLRLEALHHRATPSDADPDRAQVLLEGELRTVGLRCLVAIARAWDSRRIGYANEGQHPYELEVAAILGMSVEFAPDHLAAAVDHLAEHELAMAALPDGRGPDTPLGALIAEFGLSNLAADILMTIAAPALWGDCARLFGIIGNDAHRALVDELLVQHVLGPVRAPRHEVARELAPASPLCRFGLVDVHAGRMRPFASLSVDPVVLARLRMQPVDFGAGSRTVIRPADRRLDELSLPRPILLDALTRLSRPSSGRPVRVAVRGIPGSGRKTLLAALARVAGRELGVIDATLLPRGAVAFVDALRVELGRAVLRGLIPCVTRTEEVAFEEGAGRDLVPDLFLAHPGPIAVCLPPSATAPFPAGHVEIDLPPTTEGERLGVWQAALRHHRLWVRDVDALAARYRIGPGTIARAAAAVAEARQPAPGSSASTTGDDATDAIDGFVRQARDLKLRDHARRVERLASWSSLVLPPDIVDSLRELIGRVRHRRTVYERWGFDRSTSTGRGLTALFQGLPGTGKSMVAGIVARELGLDLYQVDLSKVMSKWMGETERNLGGIFDAAEDGQVVLLFDEADSLFAKRTEVKSSHDRYANLEVNYLLQRLDAFEGIAILTTNFGGSIDPAFRRRLSFRLTFPFPDEETREQLWRVHLPPELPVTGALELDTLARKYQLSGGYIRNACLRAAFLAAQEETSVTQSHLDRAVALEYAEVGKLSTGGTID